MYIHIYKYIYIYECIYIYTNIYMYVGTKSGGDSQGGRWDESWNMTQSGAFELEGSNSQVVKQTHYISTETHYLCNDTHHISKETHYISKETHL